MRLTRRGLNRTLLLRQHLLGRADLSVTEVCQHLVGLQAQENLPPFLSLSARITDVDPYDVTRGLEDRSLVRLLTLRGTVHLLAAEDASMLRAWTASVHEREIKVSQSIGEARAVEREAFTAAVAELLGAAPMAQRDLGAALAERFPAYPATQLGQLARSVAPLAQVPPRGTWKGSGGVVYQHVDRWVGHPPVTPDPTEIVRRYLRAYGPGTAADVTAWSGVTRIGSVIKTMDDLVQHQDEHGRVLYDVGGAPLADDDLPAPVRLLGTYDNVWLSHAQRDRVTEPAKRRAWMGANGASAMALFADGWLEGLWRFDDGKVRVIELLRPLTKREQAELEEESVRVEALLAR